MSTRSRAQWNEFSWLAHDLGARLIDLEINPLIVGRAGGGATAVDGRATLNARADAGT